MTDENLIIYKISCEGTLESIESQKLLEVFTPIDALAIYIYKNKRLYVWKGLHIDLIVGKYVPEAKDLILKKDSDIRILRHIVVESGSEPQDFFDDLDLQPKSLKSQLEKAEKVYEELNENIEKLRIAEKDLFAKKAYDQALEKAQELITLGSKLNNLPLIKEQKTLIMEIQEAKAFNATLQKNFEEVIFSQGNKILEIKDHEKQEAEKRRKAQETDTQRKNGEDKARQLAEEQAPMKAVEEESRRLAEEPARKQSEEEQKRRDAEEQAKNPEIVDKYNKLRLTFELFVYLRSNGDLYLVQKANFAPQLEL